jgi:hypothetical protein
MSSLRLLRYFPKLSPSSSSSLSLSLSLKVLATVIDCEFCEIECVEVIESFFEGSSRFAWEAGNRFGSELITARCYWFFELYKIFGTIIEGDCGLVWNNFANVSFSERVKISVSLWV